MSRPFRTDDQVRALLLEKGIRRKGCFIWPGRSWRGYGRINYRGKEVWLHRLAYQLFIGPIPEGMQVLHKCDNPLCYAKKHLFLGTRSDNMQDMHNKRRHCRNGGRPKGSKNKTPNGPMPESQRRNISLARRGLLMKKG